MSNNEISNGVKGDFIHMQIMDIVVCIRSDKDIASSRISNMDKTG